MIRELLILLAAQAATPEEFCFQDVATPAPVPGAATPEQRERLAALDTLRATFALDVAAGWASLSPDEQKALHRGVGPDRPGADATLTWFMRSSSPGVAAGDLGGIYNPFADVWLLTRWSRIGGALRLVDSSLLPGSALRSETAEGWTGTAGSYALALRAADARSKVQFWRLAEQCGADLLFAAIARQRRLLAERAFDLIAPWVGSIAPWQSGSAQGPEWRRIRERLIAARGAWRPLAAMPRQVRETAAPVGSIIRPDGSTLLLASPLYPSLIAAADFGRSGAAGEPTVTLLNLSIARPQGAGR